MSADAAVQSAVSALAQSPLRNGVLESPLRPVATVAQLRTQVSNSRCASWARHKSARFYLFAICQLPLVLGLAECEALVPPPTPLARAAPPAPRAPD